jgi:hypothetical protein
MTTLRNTLLALGSLALVACDGGLYTGPGGNPPVDPPADSPDAGPIDPGADPSELFNERVAPVLQAQCSAAGCHGGTGTSPLKFLPAEMTGYYDVVVSYDDRVVGYFDKTSAPLIKMVSPGPHYTASYTPAQLADIEAWLDAELEARNTGTDPPPGGTPPLTPGEASKQLIAEWSGCMDLTTWNANNVAEEWANLGSGEGPCIRCHVNGQASFIATDDSERMYEVLTTNKYYLLSYFAPNVTDVANAKMEINYQAFERVANGEYPHTEHPGFNLDSDAMVALELFYDATMARKAAGTCDPPRIIEP